MSKVTKDEALAFASAHGHSTATTFELIALARQLGVPEALGLSLPEYVQQHLGGYVRLPIDERQKAVAQLTAPTTNGGHGLKTREAAEVLGVDHATVVRDNHAGANAPVVINGYVQDPIPAGAFAPGPMLKLATHTGELVDYPEPKGPVTFNQTQGDGISWARWSWNPVTGCLHGCGYCYAREIATSERTRAGFPAGFTPLFHSERLAAPANTVIPAKYQDDESYRRVFVCSMADLYGRWVPDAWIAAVHEAMLASPQWQYILLTKFPARYVGVDLPPGAWVGTSVDEQKRVKAAEDAFRKIGGVGIKKWLSLEPLREPLEFTDLSMFDWVVIGAQTATHQPDGFEPAFAPPFYWVASLALQAHEAGCKVHIKPNCQGTAPGVIWPDEYPDSIDLTNTPVTATCEICELPIDQHNPKLHRRRRPVRDAMRGDTRNG